MTYGPVVVEMGHLVGEPLDVVGQEAGRVPHHVVVSGRDGALAHRLAHQEEIIPETQYSINIATVKFIANFAHP